MRVKPNSTGGRGVVGAILILTGAGVFAVLFVWPVWQWNNARAWEPCPCAIVSSKLEQHKSHRRNRIKTSYSVDIAYTYTYDGQTFTADRYNFFTGSSSGRSNHKIVAQYPAGSERTCYVNPDNPEEAALSIEFSHAYLLGLSGLLFMAVGLRSAIKRGTRRQDDAG